MCLIHPWELAPGFCSLEQSEASNTALAGSLLGGKSWNRLLGYSYNDFKSKNESVPFWKPLSNTGMTQHLCKC